MYTYQGIDYNEDTIFDLADFIREYGEFADQTWSPGPDHIPGIIDHLKKEILEIEKDPEDLEEWVDILLLTIDGARRAGYTGRQICQGIISKYEKNQKRKWPDWRTSDISKALEHVK